VLRPKPKTFKAKTIYSNYMYYKLDLSTLKSK